MRLVFPDDGGHMYGCPMMDETRDVRETIDSSSTRSIVTRGLVGLYIRGFFRR